MREIITKVDGILLGFINGSFLLRVKNGFLLQVVFLSVLLFEIAVTELLYADFVMGTIYLPLLIITLLRMLKLRFDKRKSDRGPLNNQNKKE